MRIVLFVLAALAAADTLFRCFTAHRNFGVLCEGLLATLFCTLGALWPYLPALLATTLGKWVCAFVGVACILWLAILLLLLFYRPQKADGSEKALIVLGAGIRKGRVTVILRARLDAALQYLTANHTAVIVVTGGLGHGEAIPEAHVMKEYLCTHGIAPSRVLVEDKSKSTEENFRFARPILQQANILPQDSIVYVTNPFHCWRAQRFAQQEGYTNLRFAAAATPWHPAINCYLREIPAVVQYILFRRKKKEN